MRRGGAIVDMRRGWSNSRHGAFTIKVSSASIDARTYPLE